jgi:hypothetical protein
MHAIIKAAYHLSRPRGFLGFDTFNRSETISDRKINRYIHFPPYEKIFKRVVEANSINGRSLWLIIERDLDEEGVFLLADRYCMFKSTYGLPDAILSLAQEILCGKTIKKMLSTRYVYQGVYLSAIAPTNCPRKKNESDREYRKRLFLLEYFDSTFGHGLHVGMHVREALEYLFGCSAIEWNVAEHEVYKWLRGPGEHIPFRRPYALTREECEIFADIFFNGSVHSSVCGDATINYLRRLYIKKNKDSQDVFDPRLSCLVYDLLGGYEPSNEEIAEHVRPQLKLN